MTDLTLALLIIVAEAIALALFARQHAKEAERARLYWLALSEFYPPTQIDAIARETAQRLEDPGAYAPDIFSTSPEPDRKEPE